MKLPQGHERRLLQHIVGLGARRMRRRHNPQKPRLLLEERSKFLRRE